MALNPREASFVDEYLIDGNGKQAAIRAGYAPGSAEVTASRLLRRDKVASALAARQRKASQKVDVTVERVLAEMATQALYDPADIAGQPIQGPKDIAKLPEQVRRAIVGWSWDRQGNFVLKLANKATALDQLAKHLGMYVERHEMTGKDGGPIQTEDVGDIELARRLAFALVKGSKAAG